MNRREFSKLSAAASLATLLPPSALAAAPESTGPKFSVMIWSLPKGLSIVERFEVAAAAGFSSVEVGREYEDWTPKEWDLYLGKLHDLKLTVDSAVPGRNPLANHEKRQALHDDILKAIPGAKRLGCKQFIYTAYTKVPGQTEEQKQDAIVDSLKYAADLCAKDEIEIVLEPIHVAEYKDEAVTSVSQAFEITRKVGSPLVKVLYDFYHEQVQAGNLIEKLEKGFDQVGLVHIADVPGRHQPGTGEVNYINIYKKLAQLKYNRYICMEFQPVGDPVTVLKAARLEAVAAIKQA